MVKWSGFLHCFPLQVHQETFFLLSKSSFGQLKKKNHNKGWLQLKFLVVFTTKTGGEGSGHLLTSL